jgi:hypothetical protein
MEYCPWEIKFQKTRPGYNLSECIESALYKRDYEQCDGEVIVDYFVTPIRLEEWKEQKTFITCFNVITVFAEGYV